MLPEDNRFVVTAPNGLVVQVGDLWEFDNDDLKKPVVMILVLEIKTYTCFSCLNLSNGNTRDFGWQQNPKNYTLIARL